jgi:acyl-CoA synthetase (AMP-forming)/AMP-acid ligase II
VAVRVAHADGRDETITFAELSASSSRFAHWLEARGVVAGDRVAIMLEPSRAFYAALFGAIKMGAIAVPLFTLFGPDGVRLRVEDCRPRLLLTNAEKVETARAISGLDVRVADDTLMAELAVLSLALRGADERRRSRRLPVHVGHHARAARGRPPHPAGRRRPDGRGPLWHGDTPGRPLTSARPRRRGATGSGMARSPRWPWG